MSDIGLETRIRNFCESKHFTNPFIQECITEFIQRHVELFGDIISVDELFERLETNLDRITFVGYNKDTPGRFGEYIGRIADNTDINEINIYFSESDLGLSDMDKKVWNILTDKDKQELLQESDKRRALIKSTIMHELAHAAYTIKDKNGLGEKHIFSETVKIFSSNEYRYIGGTNCFVEAIINYISSRIEGKKPDGLETYEAETTAIYMLAEKMGETAIIQSAWNSDEEQFKQSFIQAIPRVNNDAEKSYLDFQKYMKQLIHLRIHNKNLSNLISESKKILSNIQNLLDGKIEHKSPISETEDHIKPKELSIFQVESFTPHVASEDHLTFTQKFAKFLTKITPLMNISFIKRFVDKKISILPKARIKPSQNSSGNEFITKLSGNGEYRHLPPVSEPPGKNHGNENRSKNRIE